MARSSRGNDLRGLLSSFPNESRPIRRAIVNNSRSDATALWDSRHWLAEAHRSISRLAPLPENWDREGSPAPKPVVLDAAFRVLSEIESYEMPTAHIGPVSGGGLGIEWRLGERDLNLEILPDGSIEYLKAEKTPSGFDVDQMEEGQIPLDQITRVHQLVRWLLGES